MVKKCIKKADENEETVDYEELVMLSTKNEVILEYLVKEKRTSVNFVKMHDFTPLINAVLGNSLDSVKFLCEETDVDVNFKTYDGKTAMHAACSSGNFEILKYLASLETIDLAPKDFYGYTPLDYAKKADKESIVQFLTGKIDWLEQDVFLYEIVLGISSSILPDLSELDGAAFSNDLIGVKSQFECERFEMYELAVALHLAIRGKAFGVVQYLVNVKKVSVFVTAGLADVTAIYLAFNVSSLEIIKFLIESDAENRLQDGNHHLALIKATCLRFDEDLKVLQYLESIEGVNVLERDSDGRNALYYASTANNDNFVRYLLKNEAFDVNETNGREGTALNGACSLGYLRVTKLLIETFKADPNTLNYYTNTPICEAVESRNFALVKYLAEVVKVDLKKRCICESTVLHFAASMASTEIMEYLLNFETGANLLTPNYNGITPFDFLLRFSTEEGIIGVLKKFPANFNSPNQFGVYPIIQCINSRKFQVFMFLVIDLHVDVNVLDASNDHSSLVNLALYYGRLDIAWYLVKEAGIDPSIQNAKGVNAFLICCYCGNLESVKYLLRINPSLLNSKDFENKTPLHFAAHGNKLNIVKHLIKKRQCSVDCLDIFGCSPLHFASQFGDLALVKYLVEKRGANPFLCTKSGVDCAKLAARAKNHLVKQYLGRIHRPSDRRKLWC